MIICTPDTGAFLKQVSHFATHTGNMRWPGDEVMLIKELKEIWQVLIDRLPYEEDTEVRNFVADMKYWCRDGKQGNRLFRGDEARTMVAFKALLCDRLWVVYRRDPQVFDIYNKRGKRVLVPRTKDSS